MNIKKIIYILFFLSIIITFIFQINLTRGIIQLGLEPIKQVVAHENGYYLALINESSKGHWNLGSPYFKEWSLSPFIYPALNLNAPGFIKKIFGLDIQSTAIYLHYGSLFLLVFLALLAFSILFEFRIFGLLIGVIYLFYPYMRTWNGLVSPEINFIPFFLFLSIYFARLYVVLPSLIYELALGISAGLLFYTYPYHWTFVLTLLVIRDAICLIQERKNIYRYFVKYMAIVIVAIPYIYHMWNIIHLTYYTETMRRIGLIYSRFPAGLMTQAIVIVTFAGFVLFFKYFAKAHSKRFEKQFVLIESGLLASLVVLNQQFITGMQLEYNSHYLPVIMIFVIIAIGLCLIQISYESFKKKCIIFFCTIIVMLIFIIYWVTSQCAVAQYNIQTFEKLKSSIEIENWFLSHNIANAIVYAPPELIDSLPTLTGNYVYFSGNQKLQLIPNKELIDRFIYFDIMNSDITENPSAYQHLVFGHTFDAIMQKDDVINRVKKILGISFTQKSLENYIQYDFSDLVKKRRNVNAQSFLAYMKKYHVEYVIYKSNESNKFYKNIPGNFLFDNKEYIIKELNV